MRSEIRLEFQRRTDKDGKVFLFARPNLPATIDLRDAVFFVWPDDSSASIALAAPRRTPRGEVRFDDDAKSDEKQEYGDED